LFVSASTIKLANSALLTQAQSGDTQAQIELAMIYQKENKFSKAHYWLINSALQGNDNALVLLAHLFESDENKQFHSLALAENWYSIGRGKKIKEAELGYFRVLEAQFNDRRAKQISSFTLLNDQIDNDLQRTPDQSSTHLVPAKHNIQSDIIVTLVIFILILFLVVIKRIIRQKSNTKKNSLSNQLTEQSKKIKYLKKQLITTHTQLKNNQAENLKEKANQNITVAFTMLGFQPTQIPSEREIKMRYKKLSRIYHPDVNGSDAEMKRLNTSVKIVSNYLKQIRQNQ